LLRQRAEIKVSNEIDDRIHLGLTLPGVCFTSELPVHLGCFLFWDGLALADEEAEAEEGDGEEEAVVGEESEKPSASWSGVRPSITMPRFCPPSPW